MKSRVRQRANRRLKRVEEKAVKCELHYCAANKDSFCRVLSSNNFGDQMCPFFKTTEQNEKEKKAAMARLIALERHDLIDRYYGGKEGGVDDGC